MYSLFIGCDMSKVLFDVSFKLKGKQICYLGRFDNSVEGFKFMAKALEKLTNQARSKWLVCFENTGAYSKLFLQWLSENSISCKEEVALKITYSSGLKRGKSDKIDSKDITRYIYEKRDTIKLTKLPMPLLIDLKHLLSRRDFLVRKKQSTELSIKEKKKLLNSEMLQLFESQNQEIIEMLQKQIVAIEYQIKNLIKQDPVVQTNYNLVLSITGIGPVISAYLIAYTENFTLFKNSRKFASYAGVAPFPNSSGIRFGRAKVSKMANKKIKSLLSNGAISAITFDKELRLYYQSKLEQGKAKGTVINAVKNKLIHRVFAVVKRQSPYVKIVNYV